jgi:predicted transcriptional regulator
MATETKLHPRLGAGELEVLCTLWPNVERTVRQVHGVLPKPRRLAQGTVQTMLRRLRKKGFVKSRAHGRSHIYFPVISRETVITASIQHITNLYFGSVSSEFAKYVAKHVLSRSERLALLQELGTIADEKSGL